MVAQQRLADYRRQLDEFIRPVRDPDWRKWKPDPDALIDLRATEYQLLWLYRNGIVERPPIMVFTGASIKNKEALPGRVLEVRLASAGLDVWEMGLEKKLFRFSEFAGRTNVQAVTNFFIRPLCSTNYPSEGDFVGSTAYALNLVTQREWADAARHFSAAATNVPFGGTTTLEWEYSNLTSAAWASLFAGQIEKSRGQMNAARQLPLMAEVPQRARFLLHLFRFPDAPPLAATWETILPK